MFLGVFQQQRSHLVRYELLVGDEGNNYGSTMLSEMVECVKNGGGLTKVEADQLTDESSYAATSKDSSQEDDFVVPGSPRSSYSSDVGSHEKLGTAALTVLVFYSVSGGPFGVEPAVRAGGNFFTLLGFAVAPILWALPEAMMTAELGAAFPEASGGVAWVEEAFGPKAGWMSGFVGWVSGATDNAIYPVLFLDYLLQVVNTEGEEMNPWYRFVLLAGTSMALAYVNWLGLPLVGKMSMTICLIAMSPFIVLSIVGAFKVQPHRWLQMPDSNVTAVVDVLDDDINGGFFPQAALGGILWRPFLNNLFWNLNSFDSAANFSADVQDPGRSLPRVLSWSVLLSGLCYFIPLLVTLGASDTVQSDWVDGYLARACSEIVGPWLGGWTVFAAAISNIALFQSELSADAFQLMGMADRGHLPKIFSTRSRHGTPTYGILLGSIIIVLMGVSHLDELIEMLNFNYAISLLMEYFAFIKLRVSQPDLHRPYKIPLNTACCILAFIPPVCLTFGVLCLATYKTYLFSALSCVMAVLIYITQQTSWMSGAKQLLCETIFGARYAQVETDSVVNPPIV